MKCREVHNKIYFFIDNDLAEEEASHIREHIGQCDSCRHLYEEMMATVSVIEREKQVEINPFFYTRLQQHIQNNEPVYVRKPSLIRSLQWIPAALVIIGLVIGIILGNAYYKSWTYADTSDRSENIQSLKETYFIGEQETESLAYSFYNFENNEE
ncbi:MAG: zf-HC2 domain-containing protein [Bacteroidales bacterium]|nr:zf-HC2 domain-containing protein [Bacteroidales bacterium]